MDDLVAKNIRSINIPPIGSPGGNTRRGSVGKSKEHGRKKLSLRKNLTVATWNIQGLVMQPGKLEIIERETADINIVGLCETHWAGSGHFTSNKGNTIYYSGHPTDSIHGVAIIIPKYMQPSVLAYNPVSSRILTIKLNAGPCKLNIIQVYAPTSSSSTDETENFYNQLEEVLQIIPDKEIKIIQGDFNAKIGQTWEAEHMRSLIGKYGLGTRNEAGQRMAEFAVSNKLAILNTLFSQHPRRRYTWISPGGQHRNQIDYILIQNRWRSSITNVKTLPGRDCGSDHNLLQAKMRIHLKIRRQEKRPSLRKNASNIFAQSLEASVEAIPENALTEESEAAWQHLKTALITAKREATGKIGDTIRKKEWMSEETWHLINNRKNLKQRKKNLTRDEQLIQYRDLSRKIQHSCRRDINQHLQNKCSEIQESATRGESRELFLQIKRLTRDFKPKSWKIENKNGQIITGIEEMVEVWGQYCEELYANKEEEHETTPGLSVSQVEHEPGILKSEVEDAVHKLKNNRSPGEDDITGEMLKLLSQKGIKLLWKICDKIWHTGQWPEDWRTSIFVPLHKKGPTEKCSNYRTVSLISHPSKVMLQILLQRLSNFLDWQIPQEQAGFVRGKGTREQIMNVRQIIEKAREFGKPTFLCFLDYSKALELCELEQTLVDPIVHGGSTTSNLAIETPV